MRRHRRSTEATKELTQKTGYPPAQTKAGLRQPTHATAELNGCSALSPWLPWSPVAHAMRSQAQPSHHSTTKTCNGLHRSTGAGGTCCGSEIAVAAACARALPEWRGHMQAVAARWLHLMRTGLFCICSKFGLVWFCNTLQSLWANFFCEEQCKPGAPSSN